MKRGLQIAIGIGLLIIALILFLGSIILIWVLGFFDLFQMVSILISLPLFLMAYDLLKKSRREHK